MRFRRLRTRIIVFFVALLALVQVTGFVFVHGANLNNARAKAEEELNVGQRVFARLLLAQNTDKLSQAARVLAADFAFREAIATHDVGTISSALTNHGERIGADAVLLIDLKGKVIANTLDLESVPQGVEFSALIDGARREGTSTSIQLLGDRAYQLLAVPVLAPMPIGWIVLGFAIDDSLARDLRQLTTLDVSFFLEASASRWQRLASTLERAASDELSQQMPPFSEAVSTTWLELQGDDFQVRVVPLGQGRDAQVLAVLQRSYADRKSVV